MRFVYENNKIEFSKNCFLEKFQDDNFEYEDSKTKIVCEGVIFNSASVLQKYEAKNIAELIEKLFVSGGVSNVCNTLHGSYVITVLDKMTNRCFVFNDMLSKRAIYFSYSKEYCVASTSFFDVADMLYQRKVNLEVDYEGVDTIIKKGVFEEDNTYFKQIKFLRYCEYIEISGEYFCSIQKYTYQDPYSFNIDKDDVMKHLYEIFEKSCREAIEKNASAGYKPVFSLSGGMDSRSTIAVSRKYCTDEPIGYSYGEKDCMDIKIASAVAEKYHCRFLSCDTEVDFIEDREAIININEGQMIYVGPTMLYRFIHNMDTSKVGIVMSGLGGGEIMGDVCIRGNDNANERIQDIRRCLGGYFSSRDVIEVFSPYLDEDFFNLMLKIDYEKLRFRKFYYEWYCRFINDSLPVTCVEGRVRRYKSADLYRFYIVYKRRIFDKLRIRSKWVMTPFTEWYSEGTVLCSKMAEMINHDTTQITKTDSKLAEYLIMEYSQGSIMTKFNVLTASAVMSRYSMSESE